jgi:DEAD/DEAH box helicase domain-containing protein
MHTTSYWLTIPSEVMGALPYGSDDRRDGVIGLAFAMRHVAQLLLMCDHHDVGVSIDGEPLSRSAAASPAEARTGEGGGIHSAPNVFIYDNYPGGIGFSRPLFEMHALLLERTRELITGCPCESGCPSCVGPEGNTGPYAKLVASAILDRLIGGCESATAEVCGGGAPDKVPF